MRLVGFRPGLRISGAACGEGVNSTPDPGQALPLSLSEWATWLGGGLGLEVGRLQVPPGLEAGQGWGRGDDVRGASGCILLPILLLPCHPSFLPGYPWVGELQVEGKGTVVCVSLKPGSMDESKLNREPTAQLSCPTLTHLSPKSPHALMEGSNTCCILGVCGGNLRCPRCPHSPGSVSGEQGARVSTVFSVSSGLSSAQWVCLLPAEEGQFCL
jgi:hypothetical protein